ncbi:uncharacterized protein F5891DRAFT_660541 [Suillus fuscotomentosus]|uniref:Fucose-specific lectin n=1 Tax=Suillus fuscotomentosus TaxID=1912939 RepID=A0AAD4DZI7_9AGAM|nr:uncharacterized protein F5891DRAFT_660541 [Suillus fuscotomentosus]KAG1895503.1 hypothetical protein F5891DRAFT_660541 [Suillus fuscotomentosus]
MSDLLPTHFVGTTMNAVQNDEGKFRVYFQNKDYQIYEMSLNDPKSTAYTLLKLTNSNIPAARINTPIAAVASNDLEEIRVFYITVDSRVQEICYFKRHGWQKGATIGTAVENSTCLYAQGRFVHNETMLRVGFQSATAPQTITEGCTTKDEWKIRVL